MAALLTETIEVRVSPEALARWKEYSKRVGQPVSRLMRAQMNALVTPLPDFVYDREAAIHARRELRRARDRDRLRSTRAGAKAVEESA